MHTLQMSVRLPKLPPVTANQLPSWDTTPMLGMITVIFLKPLNSNSKRGSYCPWCPLTSNSRRSGQEDERVVRSSGEREPSRVQEQAVRLRQFWNPLIMRSWVGVDADDLGKSRMSTLCEIMDHMRMKHAPRRLTREPR